MAYTPPESVIVYRLQRTFPEDRLRDRATEFALTDRERKFDVVAFFWALVLGFAADDDRTVQAFLERFVARSDVDTLAYTSFRNWFTPAVLDLLYDILEDHLDSLADETASESLRGRLERFRDVLIADASFVSLVDSAANVYNAHHEDTAGATVHLTESLSTGLPTRFEITDGSVHERSRFRVGPWVADALLVFDLGYYDFWLFDRIDANGGWFLTRLKRNANPECVEELRAWRGNAIPLEGRDLQAVLDDLQRDVIDVRATVSFRRQPSDGTRSQAARTFRVVGRWNDDEERYHLYITNLSAEAFTAAEIGQLYRVRWEVELLFKELKSTFGLDRVQVSEPVIIEALLVVAALSLVVSRVILDQLRELNAIEARATGEDPVEVRAAIPNPRGSAVIERHAELIHEYLMLELGYTWPDLDGLLLEFNQEPNPHRPRLREQVQFEAFPVALA